MPRCLMFQVEADCIGVMGVDRSKLGRALTMPSSIFKAIDGFCTNESF